jgi:hypothetical protein
MLTLLVRGVAAQRRGYRQSLAPTLRIPAPFPEPNGAAHSPQTMIDPNTPASVRLRAPEAIFNHAAKAIEIEDIEVRVTELERAADRANAGPR